MFKKLIFLIFFLFNSFASAYTCPELGGSQGLFFSLFEISVGSADFSETNRFNFKTQIHRAGDYYSFWINIYEPDGMGGCQIVNYNGSYNVIFSHAKINPVSGTINPIILDQNNQTWAFGNVGDPISIPIFFTNGSAFVSMRYDDVGILNIFAEIPNYNGETGPFLTRPARLDISQIPGLPAFFPVSPLSPVFKKAGELFTVKVEARNSLGNRTPNYGHEINPKGVKLKWSVISVMTPNNGSILNADGFSLDTDVGEGAFINNSVAYEGVGIIRIGADVSDGDYLGQEINAFGNVSILDFENNYINVGRFVPYAFRVQPSTSITPVFETACGALGEGFTYLRQPIAFSVKPIVNIVPIAASGNTVPNYIQSYWRLPQILSGNINISADFSDEGIILLNPNITSSIISNVNSPFSIGADYEFDVDPNFAISHTDLPGTLIPPLAADLSLTFSVVDLDNVQGTSSQYTIGSTSFGAGIKFSEGNNFYQGRIKLQNMNRSELLSAQMPMTLEYYTTDGFIPNVNDTCTQLLTAPVATESAPSELSKRVLTNEGNVDGTFTNGLRTIVLTRGNNETPTAGYVNVLMNVTDTLPWLGYPWNRGDGSENPMAQATFGIYEGEASVVYRNEVIN